MFKLFLMSQCEQRQRRVKYFAGWPEIQLSPHRQTITLKQF